MQTASVDVDMYSTDRVESFTSELCPTWPFIAGCSIGPNIFVNNQYPVEGKLYYFYHTSGQDFSTVRSTYRVL